MTVTIRGRARLLGSNINTDYIISSSRKKEMPDPHLLKSYILESVDPGFAGTVEPGDLLVAGRNFGCGSAMEIAVTVLLAAGIPAVLAPSFSRTYYRNAINNGLVPVECETAGICEGDRLKVILGGAGTFITDETSGLAIAGAELPAVALAILSEGGLVPYFLKHHDFVEPTSGWKP